MFCIHGENPLEVCQATWTPATPPSWSYLHNSMWGSHILCISGPHGETCFSCTQMMHWWRFPEATAAKSLTPCVDSSESDLSLLRGLDPPKLSYPNMNFLFDHLCSGNVSPSSSTHPALTSLSLGCEASSAWGKYVNYVGNSPLSINSCLKLHIG